MRALVGATSHMLAMLLYLHRFRGRLSAERFTEPDCPDENCFISLSNVLEAADTRRISPMAIVQIHLSPLPNPLSTKSWDGIHSQGSETLCGKYLLLVYEQKSIVWRWMNEEPSTGWPWPHIATNIQQLSLGRKCTRFYDRGSCSSIASAIRSRAFSTHKHPVR